MLPTFCITRTKQYCSRSIANIATHNQGSIWAPDDILPPLIYHPRSHGIPAAMLHFRSHHLPLLDIYTFFATHTASALGIPISKPVFLPTQRSLWTVPRGPFAHKKSQENFHRLVHKRAIKAWDADPVVIGTWLNYLEEYQLAGVGLRAVRWEHASVGFMEERMKDMDEAVKSFRRLTDRAQIAALGEEVIKQESSDAAAEMDLEEGESESDVAAMASNSGIQKAAPQ